MTIHFPDVSNYQAGLSLAGAVAVEAKASEGTGYRDPTYASFKLQAAVAGIPFCAYHFLRRGDPAGQAAYALGIVGPNTPLMLDVETAVDGTDATMADMYGFIDAYRAAGGLVTLAYLPHWYWQDHWGSPSLAGLTQRNVALISSNYTTYSDDGPGWAPYGGVTPAIWQYTFQQPFNGQFVDFNAYKGSVAELAALFAGKPIEGDDMLYAVNLRGDPGVYLSNGVTKRSMKSQAEIEYWLARGAQRVDTDDLDFYGVTVPWHGPAAGGGPLNITLSGTGTPAA